MCELDEVDVEIGDATTTLEAAKCALVEELLTDVWRIADHRIEATAREHVGKCGSPVELEGIGDADVDGESLAGDRGRVWIDVDSDHAARGGGARVACTGDTQRIGDRGDRLVEKHPLAGGEVTHPKRAQLGFGSAQQRLERTTDHRCGDLGRCVHHAESSRGGPQDGHFSAARREARPSTDGRPGFHRPCDS